MFWIKSILANIQIVAIALVIGLLGGAYGGWAVKSAFVKSAALSDIKEVMRDDAKSVIDAQTKDQKLGTEKADIALKTDDTLRALDKLIPPTPKPQPKQPPATTEIKDAPTQQITVIACAPTSINVGAVGLLNNQLNDSAVDSSKWSDAEKQTPSDVGLRELSRHITIIAGQYKALAKDHDALVDSVAEYQKKIADNRK
jgi:hypothetical protein